MTENSKGKKRKRPESRLFDELKGHKIRVVLLRDGLELTPILLWVDQYTLGIEHDGVEMMLFKHAIETINAA